MSDTVEVIQADREAAADFWAIGEKHFKSGKGDYTRIVQASPSTAAKPPANW